MPEIKPGGNFELPRYDNKKPLEENRKVFFELDKNDREKILERDFNEADGYEHASDAEGVFKEDKEKMRSVREKLSETSQIGSNGKTSLKEIPHADRAMIPIMEEVQKEMEKFDSAMADIAAGIPGTGIWEIRQTEAFAGNFLKQVGSTIDAKIDTEIAAGTLSKDEAKELRDVLSLDSNFKFWHNIAKSREKTEKLFEQVKKSSAAELLQKNRSMKRKIEVGMKRLFGIV